MFLQCIAMGWNHFWKSIFYALLSFQVIYERFIDTYVLSFYGSKTILGRSKYPKFFNNECFNSLIKNLLGQNVKVNYGAYFIGAATIFLLVQIVLDMGQKIEARSLISYENVKKYLVKLQMHQNKNNPSEMISTKCGSFVNVTIFLLWPWNWQTVTIWRHWVWSVVIH